MSLTPEQFLNPSHEEGMQEMVVLTLNGFGGIVTPWNTEVELDAAANAYRDLADLAAGEYWSELYPSYANPGKQFAIAFKQAFFTSTPSGAPPKGALREDFSSKFDPPPPAFAEAPKHHGKPAATSAKIRAGAKSNKTKKK